MVAGCQQKQHLSRYRYLARSKPHRYGDQEYLSRTGRQRLWSGRVTDLQSSKRGPALALSLSGSKKDTAMTIPLAELSADDGMQKLLELVQASFGKNLVDELFSDYEHFEKISRNSKSMTDYIADFEQAYARLRKHNLVLPKEILACKLLYCADLDESDRQLVLSATSKMNLSNMKSSLKACPVPKRAHNQVYDSKTGIDRHCILRK